MSKRRGYQHIKQGLDGNWTEIGRPKVTDIDYNTVAPFVFCGFIKLRQMTYICWFQIKLSVCDIPFTNFLSRLRTFFNPHCLVIIYCAKSKG